MNKLKSIIILLFILCASLQAQTEKLFRVIDSSGTPVTGLTSSNISFRISPYGAGNTVAETITVTEIGVQGNYRCSGFTVFQLVGLWINGVEQTWFGRQYAGIAANVFLSKSGGTMTGILNMGGYRIEAVGAPNSSDDALPKFYADTVYTGNRTSESISGAWTFSGVVNFTAPAYPTIGFDESGYQPPTTNYQFTPKQYVDSLYGSSIGVVQSPYQIKCIPLRATEDIYSKKTIEKCKAYIAGLSNYATYRGTILIENTGAIYNSIYVDDGTNQWCANGIDITGVTKPRIYRRAPNSSLTADTRLTNIYIFDDVAAGRSYTNFTFENCDFYFDTDGNSATFTSCKFLGTCRIYMTTGTFNIVNCSGTVLWTNCTDVVITGTQPIDFREGLNQSDLGF